MTIGKKIKKWASANVVATRKKSLFTIQFERRMTRVTIDFHFISFVIGLVAGVVVTIFGIAFSEGGTDE